MGVLARLAFWVMAIYIVGHAVVESWTAGEPAMAVAKVLFFPLTYTIYPWTADLVVLFFASLVAYGVSNLGGMQPID